MRKLFIVTALLTLFGLSSSVRAEEGMWLFSSPPAQEVKTKYGFELTPKFLEHLQKSSIRFSNGGSASFVSSNGLIMTNHHIAESSLNKLSTPEKNLLENGFYAATLEEELKCPELELRVLLKIADATQQINSAVKPEMTSTEAEEARRAAMNKIEQEMSKSTGNKCEIVSFYHGALYHLYQYKILTDVRLVFAPESSVGFFGGEPDNFEYPRYNLDVSFFRAYENDKPYKPEHFLAWSANGAQEDELVFVSGHPGRTDRFNTIDHLMFQRDVYYPYLLNKLRRREVLLQIYSERSAEGALAAASDLFRIRNSRKNRTGILQGLQNPALMGVKYNENGTLYTEVGEKKLIDLEKNDPWNTISSALGTWNDIYIAYDMLENGEAFDSVLFKIARNIVRYVDEKAKPNEQRLREYRESALDTMELSILSTAPIYLELEYLKLADSLSMYVEMLGDAEYGSLSETPENSQNSEEENSEGLGILNGLAPKIRAAQLIQGTKVFNINERKKLLAMTLEELRKSTDTMIQLALAIDPTSRNIRAMYDSNVAEPMEQAYTEIAKARFALNALNKVNTYPDATFTLRLSYGKIAGYKDDDGTEIPAFTTIRGAFEHAKEHNYVYPYNLPKTWTSNIKKVDLKTPLNFVSTNDIIGGNSGSPVVNTKGEVVGLIFDGNIQSLVSNFIFEEVQSRAVSVHSSGIREALTNIYNTQRIVEELGK